MRTRENTAMTTKGNGEFRKILHKNQESKTILVQSIPTPAFGPCNSD